MYSAGHSPGTSPAKSSAFRRLHADPLLIRIETTHSPHTGDNEIFHCGILEQLPRPTSLVFARGRAQGSALRSHDTPRYGDTCLPKYTLKGCHEVQASSYCAGLFWPHVECRVSRDSRRRLQCY
ncbi:hypothetical protein E2C01_006933 [Portunus trituberculatus]|uniref:Uncharacterized protein n=1 Tax=Portunus trituberculatus TaxID=210409 RepID=A0A5B7CYN1_PORTR|nr:hypothetical protein [Portunus trituberculatus]